MMATRHISGIRNAERVDVKITVTGADADGVAQSERCVTEMQRRGLEGAGVHAVEVDGVQITHTANETHAATEAALKKP